MCDGDDRVFKKSFQHDQTLFEHVYTRFLEHRIVLVSIPSHKLPLRAEILFGLGSSTLLTGRNNEHKHGNLRVSAPQVAYRRTNAFQQSALKSTRFLAEENSSGELINRTKASTRDRTRLHGAEGRKRSV